MVRRLPMAFFFVILEQREIDNPAKCESMWRDQIEILAKSGSDGSQTCTAFLPVLVGDEQEQISFLCIELFDDFLLESREIFGNAAGKRTVWTDFRPCESFCAVRLGCLLQTIDVFPRILLERFFLRPDRCFFTTRFGFGAQIAFT